MIWGYRPWIVCIMKHFPYVDVPGSLVNGLFDLLKHGVYWGYNRYNPVTHWSWPFRYWLFGTSKSYNLLLKKCLKIRHPHQKKKKQPFFPEALHVFFWKKTQKKQPFIFSRSSSFFWKKKHHILIFYSVSWFSEGVGWCRPKVSMELETCLCLPLGQVQLVSGILRCCFFVSVRLLS